MATRKPLNPSDLPDWLNPLISLPWTAENSLSVDRWLWYLEQEFEGVEL